MSSSVQLARKTVIALVILATGAALVTTPGAWAATGGSGPEWTLSGMVHYLDEDDRRNNDNGVGGHIGLGTGFMNRHAFDIAAQFSRLNDTTVNPEVTQWSGTLDYRYRLGSSTFFKPYALGSLGYIRNRFDDDAFETRKGLIAALGLGVVAPINSRLAVRGELRYRFDRSDEEQTYSDWMLSAGLELALTKQRPAPTDGDRDSVPDGQDRCEDTPAGTEVDAYGCATARDSDNDGVPDRMDMCADTPAGVETDRFGCRVATEPARPEQRT